MVNQSLISHFAMQTCNYLYVHIKHVSRHESSIFHTINLPNTINALKLLLTTCTVAGPVDLKRNVSLPDPTPLFLPVPDEVDIISKTEINCMYATC